MMLRPNLLPTVHQFISHIKIDFLKDHLLSSFVRPCLPKDTHYISHVCEDNIKMDLNLIGWVWTTFMRLRIGTDRVLL
jgi:hypothetical protein